MRIVQKIKNRYSDIRYAICNYFFRLKYPDLSFRTWNGKNVYTSMKYNMPIGWYKAFGKELCKELNDVIHKSNEGCKDDGKIYLIQVKEKYGELRIYTSYTNDEMEEVISKYEQLSYNTCCKCGAHADTMSNGYILPFCNECYKKVYKK